MTTSDAHATKSFYDRISKAYDSIADRDEHVAREKGLELLAVADGERVLEVGYGTGHSLVALAEAVGASGHVAGIDISDGMREVAEKRVAEVELSDRVELRVASAPPLPYEDNRFDVVAMSFTLELFPLEVIPEVLGEVKRVLRDGGRLGVVAMAVTAEGQKDSSLERVYKWMHQHFPHIVDCQPIDVYGLVRGAGFEITKKHDMEIWTLPVAAVVAV